MKNVEALHEIQAELIQLEQQITALQARRDRLHEALEVARSTTEVFNKVVLRVRDGYVRAVDPSIDRWAQAYEHARYPGHFLVMQYRSGGSSSVMQQEFSSLAEALAAAKTYVTS